MNTITIYENGTVYTVDSKQAICESMAIKNDKIIAVGSKDHVNKKVEIQAEKDDLISIVDLNGKMILPGFIEAHAHPAMASLEMIYQVDLNFCIDKDEYTSRIKDFLHQNPDIDFLLGAGWINPHFDINGPRKEILDDISTEIPMVMVSGDHHSMWANSKAIELAGVTNDTKSPEGGVIEKDRETGEPLGTFREEAQEFIRAIIPAYTVEQCEKAMLHYQKVMAGYGFTMSHDAMLTLDSNQHKALQSLDRTNDLLFKMTASVNTAVNKPDALKDFSQRMKKRNGKRFSAKHIKFFLDGVIEGKTAYLKEPYQGEKSYRGEKMWSDENLVEALKIIDKDGLNAHFHIIGDAAAQQMIDSLYKLQQTNGKKHRRPIAAHAQIVTPEDKKNMADFDQLIICANPYWFFKEPSYYNGIELPLLGKERVEKEYPMKSFLDLGMTIASASDFSVTPRPNPLSGMLLGVLRSTPDDKGQGETLLGEEEQMTLEEMIKTFTINAAYAVSMENETGSIEEGKLADLVILEENILEKPIEKIDQVQVVQTISEGRVIYSWDR